MVASLGSGRIISTLLIFAPIILAAIVAVARVVLYGRNAQNVKTSLRIVLWVTLAVIVSVAIFRPLH